MARQVLEGCCAPAQGSFRLFDAGVSSVVNLLLVDLCHKHQMAAMELLPLQVELVLLDISPCSEILHLAPEMAGRRQVDFVRHLSAKSVNEVVLVLLQIKIPASLTEGQTHSPSALQAGIAAKVEGALAPHELDLGDVVVGLLELQHVAHKKGP